MCAGGSLIIFSELVQAESQTCRIENLLKLTSTLEVKRMMFPYFCEFSVGTTDVYTT